MKTSFFFKSPSVFAFVGRLTLNHYLTIIWYFYFLIIWFHWKG